MHKKSFSFSDNFVPFTLYAIGHVVLRINILLFLSLDKDVQCITAVLELIGLRQYNALDLKTS